MLNIAASVYLFNGSKNYNRKCKTIKKTYDSKVPKKIRCARCFSYFLITDWGGVGEGIFTAEAVADWEKLVVGDASIKLWVPKISSSIEGGWANLPKKYSSHVGLWLLAGFVIDVFCWLKDDGGWRPCWKYGDWEDDECIINNQLINEWWQARLAPKNW